MDAFCCTVKRGGRHPTKQKEYPGDEFLASRYKPVQNLWKVWARKRCICDLKMDSNLQVLIKVTASIPQTMRSKCKNY